MKKILIKRSREITESFVELRVWRLVFNIVFLITLCCLVTAHNFYQLGRNSLVAENAELSHNAVVLQQKYDALERAKPMDPVTACPAWFAGTTDLKSTRKRLCEGNK